MDVIVHVAESPRSWTLTDLLGRSMGVIVEEPSNVFMVRTAGNAKDTMAGMKAGPFCSLDQALAAIETHTRGACRRAAEVDQPKANHLDEVVGDAVAKPEGDRQTQVGGETTGDG